MKKVGLIFLVMTQILVLQVMALESEAPLPGMNPMELKIKSQKVAGGPVGESTRPSSQEEGDGESKSEAAEGPDIRRLGKHRSTDKSVAGGGVIIGGLVTATFAAVFSYIRVTRKRGSGH